MMRSILNPHFNERALEKVYLHRDRHLAAVHPEGPTGAEKRQGIEQDTETSSRAANPDQPSGDCLSVFMNLFHLQLQTCIIRERDLSNSVCRSSAAFSKWDAEAPKLFNNMQMRKSRPFETIRFCNNGCSIPYSIMTTGESDFLKRDHEFEVHTVAQYSRRDTGRE
jgi:hypothetical protein